MQPDSGADFHSGMGQVEKRDGTTLSNLNKEHIKSQQDNQRTPESVLLASSNIELDNLRVADETTLGRASISNKGNTDRTNNNENEEQKKRFQDLFSGLEGMGDDDTLFDGLDEDVFSTPKAKAKEVQENHIQTNLNINTLNVKDQEEEIDFEEKLDPNHKAAFNKIKTQSLRVANNRIYDPQAEIEKLKEQLRIKSSEIELLTLQMIHYNQAPDMQVSHSEPLVQSSSYHLAFLFSSPLVRKINSNLEMIMQLDYINEIKNIEKQLKHVKHEVRYKVDVATISNFRSVIADAPFALHFTGHGIRNDAKALGPSYMQYKDRGDILLLEDENSMADYLFENDLKRLVQISKANKELSNHYEVVFVSS